MTYTEKYIKSFGKLTPKEIEIVKGTLRYQRYLLADAWIDLQKEIRKELKRLIK